MPMMGLRPEQGPPLSVPASFFLTAPLALAAAGVLLLVRGAEGGGTLWGPTSVAVVHFGTVGMLLFVMLGALYQLLPVVAGAVVPWVRLAHGVHALLVAGGAALIYGQATGEPRAFGAAAALLTVAVLLFLVPAAVAVLRSQAKGATALGLSLGLAALAAVVFAGLRLSLARGGHTEEAGFLSLRAAHAHLGFLTWVGGLITSVSWQVLPMFFLTPSPPVAVPGLTQGGVALTLLGLGVALFGVPPGTVAFLAAPGALAVWGLQPGWALVAMRARKRKRKDPTLWFWWLGMGLAPACLLLGAATAWLDDERWPLLYGLVVLWGWAGAVVHGMLLRIVPFLVWLHRCAPLIGKARMPSAKELLPDAEVTVGFALHVLTLAVGLAAVLLRTALAWRTFGAALLVTGAWLGWVLTSAIRRAKPKT